MSRRMQRIGGIGAAIVLLLVGRASATYHTYRFAEIYSNPSGTIQFIEMHEAFGASGQNLETMAPDLFSGPSSNIGNSAHDFTFPNNLPSSNTANTFFLLGTAGYNAIPGAPKADYTIPAHFFNPAGDSLQYGTTGPDGVVDTITFGALPSDPTKALFRTGTFGSNFTTGQAVANTFSNGGNFDITPEPASMSLLMICGAMLLVRRRASI